MWTRNNDVSNRNMLKHFIYSSSSKSTTSLLCSLYYKYSSKLSSFFCILSFLVRAISIDQTFYSATHYLAAVWLDSKHDFNMHSLKLYLFDALTCISTAWHNWYMSREILDRCKDSSYLIKEERMITSIACWQYVKFFLQANSDCV